VDADWSVELGADDPALEFPWSSPDGQGFIDLSKGMDGLDKIAEAMQYPALRSFLIGLNGSLSPWLSVKCDTWMDEEVTEHLGQFAGRHRQASYVDLIRRDESQRFSFQQHEQWARAVTERLSRFPDGHYFCESIVRRCYYHLDGNFDDSTPGFYLTVYVFGFGDEEAHAQTCWKGGLDRVSHALLSVAP
jgi:hypothetical protein